MAQFGFIYPDESGDIGRDVKLDLQPFILEQWLYIIDQTVEYIYGVTYPGMHLHQG